MKKTTFLLFMTIFMVAITTIVMLLSFFVLDATKDNFLLINLLSIVGYLGAACYYNRYLQIKKS
jgi:cbb3-type cytochrome oxidase cytochrome c subunit